MSKIPPQRIGALFHVFKLFNCNHCFLTINSNANIAFLQGRIKGYRIKFYLFP